jgi:hypothetical protein
MAYAKRAFATFLFLVLPLSASLLSVSSSVTLQPGSLTPVSNSESVTGTFTLLVTGGTGSAYWLPALELNGSTNESNGLDTEIGGYATSTWPYFIDVGDPHGSATNQDYPFFSCDPEHCEVPFTFGVEQQFTITMTASSIIDPLAPQLGEQTVTTTGEFGGVVSWSSCPNQLCAIPVPTYDLEQVSPEDPPNPIPEGSSPGSVGLGLTGCLLFRRRFLR